MFDLHNIFHLVGLTLLIYIFCLVIKIAWLLNMLVRCAVFEGLRLSFRISFLLITFNVSLKLIIHFINCILSNYINNGDLCLYKI